MAEAKKIVEYTGKADVRVIHKSHFAKVGLDHEAVRFDRTNDHKQEVSPEAADWLVANDSFELVESKA